MNLNIIEQHLRDTHNLPDNFHFYRWECFPKRGDTIYVEIKGMRTVPFKRGPLAGTPNWSKGINGKTFNVTVHEANEIEASYAERTGNCIRCEGSARELARAGVDPDGKKFTEYRPCGKCNGSGKASK